MNDHPGTHHIDPDNGLFPVAFAVLRCIWKPFALAVAVMLLASLAQGYLHDPLPLALIRALALIIAGHAAYRALITQGRVAGWRAAATREGHVPWRYAGVMLMILTPMLLLGLIWTAPHARADGAGAAFGPSGLEGVVLAMILMIGYAVGYVLLGTALPEIAERGDAALSRAISRGRVHYRRIASWLMFGPWLFRTSTVVLLVAASFAGIAVDFFHPETGAFQPSALVPMALLTGGTVFAEILTAVVLVRAYRRL